MRIGVDELVEIARLWNVPEAALQTLREKVRPDDAGAWLFRYLGPRHTSKASEFEQQFAERLGAKHALAVNSGTSALIAALAACGIGPGDEVLVPAYTFFATAAAVVAVGALPVLCEIDETLGLDPAEIERRSTPRTRAVISVHMRGRPCDMDGIIAAARRSGLQVIEDVAQACGGSYKGRMLGTFGDIGCFSFGQYKVLSAGEGGAVVTNDDRLFARTTCYHDTAACWRPDRYAPEAFEGELFSGQNFRMSELHAAVACAQLRKLDVYLAECRNFSRSTRLAIDGALPAGISLAPANDAEGDCSLWLIFLCDSEFRASALIECLGDVGIRGGGQLRANKRDWHVHVFWDHLRLHRSYHRSGFPFSGVEDPPVYDANACPRTIAVLQRMVSISLTDLAAAMNCSAASATLLSAANRAARSPR